MSFRPGHDSLCLICSGQTLSHNRRLRRHVFWEGSPKCIVSNTLCSVLRLTICLQLRVLWVLRNVSTESLRTSHVVFPVRSGQVKDKVVPVKITRVVKVRYFFVELVFTKRKLNLHRNYFLSRFCIPLLITIFITVTCKGFCSNVRWKVVITSYHHVLLSDIVMNAID